MVELIAWWCCLWCIPITFVILFASIDDMINNVNSQVDGSYVRIVLAISGLCFVFAGIQFVITYIQHALDWIGSH